MPSQIEKKIESLRKKIRDHDYKYYILTETVIGDEEYDNLVKVLEKLEAEHPELITLDSPTQRVGKDLTEESKHVKHKIPILSLANTYNEEELYEFNRRVKDALPENEKVEYIVEFKIDGASVSLNYVDGILKTAATRGDGVVGEEITNNVRTMRTIPLKVNEVKSGPYKLEDIEVRGEIFMNIKDFINLNKEREKRGEKLFANPRNSAAGTLKMKDPKEVAKRPLNNFIYNLISIYDELKSHEENLVILNKLGFKVNGKYKKCSSMEEVIETCQKFESMRDELEYEIDGAVIKVNSIAQQNILGNIAKSPKWAVAFKFQAKQAYTNTIKIVWQVGRTGAVTPVAELDPVLLAGSTIKRATLHNIDEIRRKDIRKGDRVIIEKGGDVIPKVVSVVLSERKKESGKTKPPVICPSCHTLLFKSVNEVAYYCQNLECPAQLTNKLQHFVSRDALDIEAIAESVSDKLIETNLIYSPLDLFNLDVETLASLNLGTTEEPRTFGSKNATKVVQALETAKTKPLEKWLFALGLPKLGQVGAQAIAEKHKTFQDIINSPILSDIILLQKLIEKGIFINPRSHKNPVESELEKKERTTEYNRICDKVGEVGKRLVKAGWYKQNERKSKKSKTRAIPEYVLKNNEGIGVEAAKSVLNFLNSDIGTEILEKLKKLEIHPVGEIKKKGKFEGKNFVLTGTLPSLKRPEATELIIQNGGKVLGTVSKSTNYIVAGDKPGSKFEDAKKFGIEIISEEQFLKMISEHQIKNEVSDQQKAIREKLDFKR